MWILMNDAFLSIVEPGRTYTEEVRNASLLVRARRREDLERVFPAGDPTRIQETAEADYRFRVLVKREAVADAIGRRIIGIGYSNFKDSVREGDRHNLYARVWSVLYGLQRSLFASHRHDIFGYPEDPDGSEDYFEDDYLDDGPPQTETLFDATDDAYPEGLRRISWRDAGLPIEIS